MDGGDSQLELFLMMYSYIAPVWKSEGLGGRECTMKARNVRLVGQSLL